MVYLQTNIKHISRRWFARLRKTLEAAFQVVLPLGPVTGPNCFFLIFLIIYSGFTWVLLKAKCAGLISIVLTPNYKRSLIDSAGYCVRVHCSWRYHSQSVLDPRKINAQCSERRWKLAPRPNGCETLNFESDKSDNTMI